MPFDPSPEDQHARVTLHRNTCPQADQIKTRAVREAEKQKAREEAVFKLCTSTGARAVVALYDDGLTATSWRNGIPAEDLRQEAITAANKLRYDINSKGTTL
jgi:hypothetical protein